ncbi:hypothetical protein [Pseudoramibacter sp.]|jgi:hypothetical protein|uniref:hypothetical protein n=1 Tax=Pseudoramibacter sp. TaxID=2034862 RepID=UPI0025CFAA78|nr:hypothetical protein [Pseudoramibacter sp.]MCH4071873.1 hypothetical protein [Pseudoramibacter sp.]MCH4105641.1 hypothetical protein [Pseudoramibacter sp.]
MSKASLSTGRPHTDAYYSTLDAIIRDINHKLPDEDIHDGETLERLLDDVLMHFKYEGMF